MKKLTALLLALSVLLLPMAGHASADELTGSPEPGHNAEFLPGSVPAQAAELDAIRLPLHALVLAMVEQELDYDADSDLFVWTALYYTLSLYGAFDLRAQFTDRALLLPSECPADFFHALFSGRAQLPDIPQELSDRISFDAGSDHYLLALGDFGLSELTLEQPVPCPDGTLALPGALNTPDNSSPICAFTARLVRNDSMFGYGILDLTLG